MPAQESMLYLGSTIHGSGRFGCEVSRKIGAATADFRSLQTVWKHASVRMPRKVQLFEACIQSKLRYALASAWLLKADLRRLDGFQASCLRKILGIPHSFYSRISNATVLARSGCTPFSATVKSMQLKLLENVLSNPRKNQLREVAFHGHTIVSETAAYVRCAGRPRQNWTEQVMAMRAAM